MKISNMNEKRRHFLREVLLYSLIIFLIFLFIQGLGIYTNSRVLRMIFQNQYSIFYTFKVYFFALSIFIFLEYFIAFSFPNNYLLSRVASGIIFLALTSLFYGVYQLLFSLMINKWIYLLLVFIAIFLGQIFSLLFQRRRKFEAGFYLGFVNYFALLIMIIVFTFINIL